MLFYLKRLLRKFTRRRLAKLGLFVLALFLFTLALVLLKEGARQLAPFIRDSLQVDNAANALGFGWRRAASGGWPGCCTGRSLPSCSAAR